MGMRESLGGYTPGSVVWVPWSVARPQERRRSDRPSWLSRLFGRSRRVSLYQRCLAIHIMSASRPDSDPVREVA
jgi:hypothetical protein